MLIKQKVYNIIIRKAICLAVAIAFFANDLAFAIPEKIYQNNSTLAAPTQLTEETFREKFLIGQFLLSDAQVNLYIKEQVEREREILKNRWESERTIDLDVSGYRSANGSIRNNVSGLSRIKLVKVTGLLARTGQFAHVGLTGRDYGGVSVMYVDSSFCNWDNDALRKHEIEEILQWEDLRVNILKLTDKSSMRAWMIANADKLSDDARAKLKGAIFESCNCVRDIAHIIHARSQSLEKLYTYKKKQLGEIGVRAAFDFERISELFNYSSGDPEEAKKINIAAKPDEPSIDAHMQGGTERTVASGTGTSSILYASPDPRPAEILEPPRASTGVFNLRALLVSNKTKIVQGASGTFWKSFHSGLLLGAASVAYVAAISVFRLPLFIGGMVFSTGLITIVLGKRRLFTGDTLLFSSLLKGEVSISLFFRQVVLKTWPAVIWGNLAGSLAAAVVAASGIYALASFCGFSPAAVIGATAVKIASAKLGLGVTSLFVKAVFCNILVTLAVLGGVTARNKLVKSAIIVPPIATFIAARYEHSVANMFLIPFGVILSALAAGTVPGAFDVILPALPTIIIQLSVAIIGNIAGGFITSAAYSFFIGPGPGRMMRAFFGQGATGDGPESATPMASGTGTISTSYASHNPIKVQSISKDVSRSHSMADNTPVEAARPLREMLTAFAIVGTVIGAVTLLMRCDSMSAYIAVVGAYFGMYAYLFYIKNKTANKPPATLIESITASFTAWRPLTAGNVSGFERVDKIKIWFAVSAGFTAMYFTTNSIIWPFLWFAITLIRTYSADQASARKSSIPVNLKFFRASKLSNSLLHTGLAMPIMYCVKGLCEYAGAGLGFGNSIAFEIFFVGTIGGIDQYLMRRLRNYDRRLSLWEAIFTAYPATLMASMVFGAGFSGPISRIKFLLFRKVLLEAYFWCVDYFEQIKMYKKTAAPKTDHSASFDFWSGAFPKMSARDIALKIAPFYEETGLGLLHYIDRLVASKIGWKGWIRKTPRIVGLILSSRIASLTASTAALVFAPQHLNVLIPVIIVANSAIFAIMHGQQTFNQFRFRLLSGLIFNIAVFSGPVALFTFMPNSFIEWSLVLLAPSMLASFPLAIALHRTWNYVCYLFELSKYKTVMAGAGRTIPEKLVQSDAGTSMAALYFTKYETELITGVINYFDSIREGVYRSHGIPSAGITASGGAYVETSLEGMKNLWFLLKTLGASNGSKFYDMGYNDASVVVTMAALGLDSSGDEKSRVVAASGKDCWARFAASEEFRGVVDPQTVHLNEKDSFDADLSQYDFLYFYFTPPSINIAGKSREAKDQVYEQLRQKFKTKLLGPTGLKKGARLIVKCAPDRHWLTEADGFRITSTGLFKIYELADDVHIARSVPDTLEMEVASPRILNPKEYQVSLYDTGRYGSITNRRPVQGDEWLTELKKGGCFVKIVCARTGKVLYLADNHGLLPVALKQFEAENGLSGDLKYEAVDLDDHEDSGPIKTQSTEIFSQAANSFVGKKTRSFYTFTGEEMPGAWVNMGNFWTYLAHKGKLSSLLNVNLHRVRETATTMRPCKIVSEEISGRPTVSLKASLWPAEDAITVTSAHLDNLDGLLDKPAAPAIISFCFDALNKAGGLEPIKIFADTLSKRGRKGFVFGALSTDCCTSGVWSGEEIKDDQVKAIRAFADLFLKSKPDHKNISVKNRDGSGIHSELVPAPAENNRYPELLQYLVSHGGHQEDIGKFMRLFSDDKGDVILELGCGAGKTLYDIAKANPLLRCFETDRYSDSLGEYEHFTTLYDDRKLDAHEAPLPNLAVARADDAIVENIPDGSIDYLLLNAPSRNLLTKLCRNADTLAKKLKAGGKIIIRPHEKTDFSVSYCEFYEKGMEFFKLPDGFKLFGVDLGDGSHYDGNAVYVWTNESRHDLSSPQDMASIYAAKAAIKDMLYSRKTITVIDDTDEGKETEIDLITAGMMAGRHKLRLIEGKLHLNKGRAIKPVDEPAAVPAPAEARLDTPQSDTPPSPEVVFERILYDNIPIEWLRDPDINISPRRDAMYIFAVDKATNNILGHAGAIKVNDKAGKATLECFDLWVNPTYQHNGVGTKLSIESARLARELGIDRLVFQIFKRNERSIKTTARAANIIGAGLEIKEDTTVYTMTMTLPVVSGGTETASVVGIEPMPEIADAVDVMDNKVLPALDGGRAYEVRYDKMRLQSSGEGAIEAFDKYIECVRSRVQKGDPKSVVKVINRPGVLFSVASYKDITKSERIGEARIDIPGDIAGLPVDIVAMLNVAFDASNMYGPHLNHCQRVIDFIKATGAELIPGTIWNIVMPRPVPLTGNIREYYELVTKQLRQYA